MNIYNPGTKMPTYSPLWSNADLELPRDRATMNAWARSAYVLDPDINRTINQHVLLIAGAYELIDSKSHKANQLCSQQLEAIKISELIDQVIREYFILGETFIYLELDEKNAMWSRAIIQNPDYIIVKRSVTGDVSDSKYFLRPDENLRRICFSNRPEDIAIRNLLSSGIIETVRKGENIQLDSFHLFHLIHKFSPYEIRGTSFIVPLFWILKTPGFPTMQLEERQLIRQTLWDITAFDKQNVAKDVLFQRYSLLIEGLEFWLNQKLLAPIAKLNSLYTEIKGEKTLTYPQVRFNMTKLKRTINKIK